MASISPEDIKKPLNKQGFPFLKMRLSCAVGNTKSSCEQQSISRKDPVDSYTSQCHWTGASIGSMVEHHLVHLLKYSFIVRVMYLSVFMFC